MLGRSTCMASPSSGNSTNVEPNTTLCSRQSRAPANAACGDSRAPYRKNSSPIANVVAWLATVAPVPRAGIIAAIPTVHRIARMYGSIRSRLTALILPAGGPFQHVIDQLISITFYDEQMYDPVQ